jgi:hypothetical protein
MFFFGLLSTPLPYLLLAAFYFFGFAVGMFNNSTGDEAIETVSSVSIPVEVKQKTNETSVHYTQANNHKIRNQTDILKPEDKTTAFIPDTGTIIFQVRNIKVHELLFPGFQFSRPPPSGC